MIVKVNFVKAKSFVQKLFTILAVIMLAGVTTVTIVCAPKALAHDALTSFGTENINGFYGIFTLVILAPWAFAGFDTVVGFGYTSAAAYKLSKAENNRRIMATGLAGAVISAVFAVVQIIPRMVALEAMGSEAFFLLALWCLLGFIFYWRTLRETTLAEFSGMSVSGIILFALLVYSAMMWIAKQIYSTGIEQVQSILICGGRISCRVSARQWEVPQAC